MRTLKIALFISLALNLVIIGAFVGFLGKGHHKGDRKDIREYSQKHEGQGNRRGAAFRNAPPVLLWPLLSQLDDNQRRALGKKVRKLHKDRNVSRQDARPLLDDLAAAIVAEPFDRVSAEQTLKKFRGFGTQRFDAAETAILEFVETLDIEQRKAIAAELGKRRR